MKLRWAVYALAMIALASCASLRHGASGASSPLPLPIATGDYPAHGHAPDYSWIAGRVERDLVCTYLDFGDRRRSPWGGRLALNASAEQMLELRSGDMIVVKGELTRLAYGSCGSLSFVVATIEEH
ncbi:MAG: hypothetical protein M3Z41_10960 [Candidatus Eremiobacteraeota bacterium]|nr:hypothetical protein [Candidatus Eremiobacteraeota bacterium]